MTETSINDASYCIIANIELLNETVQNDIRRVNCKCVLKCPQINRTKTVFKHKEVKLYDDIVFTQQEIIDLWKSKSRYDEKTITMEVKTSQLE